MEELLLQNSNMSNARSSVDLRALLRVPAVDSYARNFQGERARLQEILEATLCYGILCVSRNFQLKGITVDELVTVTKHGKTKSLDFFVRNGAAARPSTLQARAAALDADPQPVHGKPSHSWRDGEHLGGAPAPTDRTGDASDGEATGVVPDVVFLPHEAQRATLDEVDFYTKLLGKPFVDVAWATYSRRGTAYLNQEQLSERVERLEQSKRPDGMPSTEFPVCSFVEFLDAYVKQCVAKTRRYGQVEPEPEAHDLQEVASVDATASGHGRERPIGQNAISQAAARGSTSRRRVGQSLTTPRQPTSAPPRSLQHVQSKIEPDLRAHREKLLRVKKTQTQLMKESLARTRMAEYAARRSADEAARATEASKSSGSLSALPRKRMPLDKITPGAAALEIVDEFMKSPLMDTFGGADTSATRGRVAPRGGGSMKADSLQEELYGKAAHDDSFLGCKAPPPPPAATRKHSTASREAKAHSSSARGYSGWLGDFGPRHTKTVRPQWAVDASDDDPDDEAAHAGTASSKKDTRFAWKFDMSVLAEPGTAQTRRSERRRTSGCSNSEEGEDDEHDHSDSDSWSAERSGATDPVYRWLKTAVS